MGLTLQCEIPSDLPPSSLLKFAIARWCFDVLPVTSIFFLSVIQIVGYQPIPRGARSKCGSLLPSPARAGVLHRGRPALDMLPADPQAATAARHMPP
jgi:hypothetical protein